MTVADFEIDGDDPNRTEEEDVSTAEYLELAAQVELLTEENERLRTEYARSRQSQYRKTALGLGTVGLIAGVAGLLFAESRDVLFVLAGTGLFGGVLTHYLTPGQFVAADVGERVYAGLAANQAAIAAELGLGDERVYLPDDDRDQVSLFVPRHREFELPDAKAGPIVTEEGSRGLLLETTGERLFDEFERGLTGELAETPGALTTQLTDGLVESLELARSADPDVDPETGRATIAITESAFGDVSRFDHPIASFFAVGFATGLGRPVSLEVEPGDERADWLVTCRWKHDER